MRNKMGKKSVYLNMTVHMVTVFSLVILLGSIIYFLSMRSFYTEDVIAYNEQILHQSVSTYEVFLNSTIGASMVYMEQENASHIDNLHEEPHVYDNKIYTRLTNVQKISDFIYSVYYLDHAPQSVYLSSGLKFDYTDFYDKGFLDILDYSKNYYILPARQLPTLDYETKNILPVVISVPLNAIQHSGTYIINLDANRLFHYLIKNSNFNENMVFKIVDSKGMIIASSVNSSDVFKQLEDFSPPLDLTKSEASTFAALAGKEKLVSYVRSSEYDWTYICYEDRNLIFDSMFRPLQIIIVIALSSVLLSIILAVYMSNKFSKPVREIVKLFGGKAAVPKNANEYDTIRNILNQYSAENKQFQEIVGESREALKKQFEYRLITQNRYTRQEIKEQSESLGMALYEHYLVLVIAIDNEEDYFEQFDLDHRILLEISLENLIMSTLQGYGEGFLVNYEAGNFALVFSTSAMTEKNEAEQTASNFAFALKEKCKSLLKFSLSIGIGRVKDMPDQIHASFKEAVKALDFRKSIGNDEVILFNEVVVASLVETQYSSKLEAELIQHLIMNEQEKADKTLEEIFDQFKDQRFILPINLHIFSIRLLNALAKLIMELGIAEKELIFNDVPFSSLTEKLLQTQNEKECMGLFSSIIRGLSGLINQKRNLATYEKVSLMTRYVEEHYSETVSLDILADYAKLNRCYAGRIFKQYTNMSIVDYVNQVRIQKALELLDNTDLKIHDIAASVGFSNTNYFIQIFKKSQGKTPGQYKMQP